MSIWSHLAQTATLLLGLGGPLGTLVRDTLGRTGMAGGQPSRHKQVAFTIAAIALAAKMASADGHASEDEFHTFQRLFRVPPREQANAARFYRMAKQSTAGFEAYATQARKLLGGHQDVLEDLLEALLLIAVTDGVHEGEMDYLDSVAEIFGISGQAYTRIRALYLPQADNDPFMILGIAPGAALADVRAAWRALVKEHHPDRHMAHGTPAEFIRVAEDRMAAINNAYQTIVRQYAECGADA